MSERDWIFEALKERGLGTALRVVSTYIFGKLRGVEDLVKCALCPNMCKFACPTHIASGSETHSPAGRARIAYYMKKGALDPSPENALPLYACLGCEACKVYCPFNFSVPDIVHSIRVQLWRRGAVPKQLATIVENLQSYGYLYGPKPAEQDRDGEVLYIRGCTARQYLPELTKLTIEVFERLGIPLATRSDEVCCGFHAYHMGAEDLFRKLARAGIELLKSSRWRYAVTSCPIVAYTYRMLYPRLGLRPPIKVYHVTEVLKSALAERRDELREVRKRVVVHDSWALSRGLDLGDLLVDVLKTIPGLEIMLPMRHGREVFDVGAYCTLLGLVDSKLAREVARERLRELREAGELIVVASPDALLLFRELGAEVHDVVEIVAEALRL